jgi:hypothetical protein
MCLSNRDHQCSEQISFQILVGNINYSTYVSRQPGPSIFERKQFSFQIWQKNLLVSIGNTNYSNQVGFSKAMHLSGRTKSHFFVNSWNNFHFKFVTGTTGKALIYTGW